MKKRGTAGGLWCRGWPACCRWRASCAVVQAYMRMCCPAPHHHTPPPRLQAALYSPLGAKEREFSLGGEVLAQGVARACLAGDALVVATQTGALWAVPRLAEPRPVKLADVPLPGPPACLAAIDPQLSPSGGLEVGGMPAVSVSVLASCRSTWSSPGGPLQHVPAWQHKGSAHTMQRDQRCRYSSTPWWQHAMVAARQAQA